MRTFKQFIAKRRSPKSTTITTTNNEEAHPPKVNNTTIPRITNISNTMALPKTYKHAVFKELGKPLVVEDAELKLPGTGEILVKVEACGVCYSDKYAQYNVFGGGFPITPGHEIIGRVAAVGDGVSSWITGDRIGAGWHGGHDGSCVACQKGLLQMCDNPIINGENKEGGYSEYVIIRAEAAVRVPAHVDAATYAPIMCAGVTTFNSIRLMGIQAGETVAVQGLGGLGHLAIQYANKLGYRVVAVSRDGSKEELARKLGAHEYVDASKGDVAAQLQKLGGAKLAIATSPSSEGMQELLGGLSILGKLLILSVPGKATFDTQVMLGKGLSIQAWPAGHNKDSEDAVKFTEMAGVETVVEKFPLSRAQEAYERMLSGKALFRVVIVNE
jgi:D-arabinose 1-dehydrogenase-like Zn-dependent alcohol dehydrogenase